MSGLTKQKIKSSNCKELLPNDDGSINTRVSKKIDILEAVDTVRTYTWATFGGVRKVTSIVFTSSAVNTFYGNTNVLTRTFTYGGAPNFDLLTETDVLVIS